MTELRQVCKIGVFGSACPSLANSVTDNPWTMSTTKFNLLSDTLKKITLPSVTIDPADCFTVTWKAHKQSDNQDLETITDSFFTMSAELEISHDVSNFAQRLTKAVWSETMYFEGTLSDSVPTKTS